MIINDTDIKKRIGRLECYRDFDVEKVLKRQVELLSEAIMEADRRYYALLDYLELVVDPPSFNYKVRPVRKGKK